MRGAARIPVHVDGTDGTSVDITADDDGRLCLIVPEINSEAGTASPRIIADWSAVAAVRPAETTRFAHDEAAQRLSGAAQRTDYCAAIRVTTCPRALRPSYRRRAMA